MVTATGPACASCGHVNEKPAAFCLKCGAPNGTAHEAPAPQPTPVETIFDKQDQLNQVRVWIMPGEMLYAVFDCKGAGTGFVAITDKRLLFYDKAMMRKEEGAH